MSSVVRSFFAPNPTPVIRGLLAAGLLGASFAALAAPPLPVHPLSAAERLAAQRADAQVKRAAAQAAGVVDNTPPALTKFAAIGNVDAQSVAPHLDVDLGFSDDLAGVQSYSVYLVSPSGQSIVRQAILQTGQKRFDGRVSVGATPFADQPFTPFSEPGTWTVDSVAVFDAGYNAAFYDHAALSAMGRATFTVSNARGYDIKPPVLTGGVLSAAKLTLSSPPPGTWDGTLPFLSAQIEVGDEGNGAVSGAYEAILTLCLLNTYHDCEDRIEMHGYANQPGQSRGRIRVAAELRPDQLPGKYIVQYVYLSDSAHNFSQTLSKDIYGSAGIDFRTLFPFTSVTISP